MTNDNSNKPKKYEYSVMQLIGIVGVASIVSMGIAYTLMINKAKSKKAKAGQASIEQIVSSDFSRLS